MKLFLTFVQWFIRTNFHRSDIRTAIYDAIVEGYQDSYIEDNRFNMIEKLHCLTLDAVERRLIRDTIVKPN